MFRAHRFSTVNDGSLIGFYISHASDVAAAVVSPRQPTNRAHVQMVRGWSLKVWDITGWVRDKGELKKPGT